MFLSMLPNWAWAAESGSSPNDTTISLSDPNGTEAEGDAQPEEDETPESDSPAIWSAPEEKTSDDETEIAVLSINPELTDAEKVKSYFSTLPGIYATKRHVTDRDDIDWSVRVADDGEIALYYKDQDTGATVTTLTTVNATTGAPASITFTKSGEWFSNANRTTAGSLVVTWNAANHYFTMGNNTNLYWDSDGNGEFEHFYFSNTPKLYNESQIAAYFAGFSGTYPLNDGSGWSVEISDEGIVSLRDREQATDNAVIESATFDTTNPSLVKTVVFYSPDWYNAAGTTAQALTLTWNAAYTWSSNTYARNEFSVSGTIYSNAPGTVIKTFVNNVHFFTGKNWANDYFKGSNADQINYIGIYPAGAGNKLTEDWKLVIDNDGTVWLYDGDEKLVDAPGRLTGVTGRARTATSENIARISGISFLIPGYYTNSTLTTPAAMTFTWTDDSTNGSAYQGAGIGRFTTSVINNTWYDADGQAVYLPALYLDHETMYTAKAKDLLASYAGTYTLDDGSGWHVEIGSDGGVTLFDADGNAYAPFYYTLSTPLNDATRALSSVAFRSAEWYNAGAAAGYQTLTLTWNTPTALTASGISVERRMFTCSNTAIYDSTGTLVNNLNGNRFTSTSWANEYFKSSSTNEIDYTGTYDLGAGYGEQYPLVKDWKLVIDTDGFVWLQNADGNLSKAPATLSSIAAAARTSEGGVLIPRVNQMLVAVPGYYTNADTKQQAYLTLTWAYDNTANAAYQGNGTYRFTSTAINNTWYDGNGNSVSVPALYFDHNEKANAAAKGFLSEYAGTYTINDGSGWYITVDSDGSVTLYDDNGDAHSPYYYTLTNPLNDETRALSSITFGDADWYTGAGAAQTLTLTWSPAKKQFAGSNAAVTLYDNAQNAFKSFSASVVFSSNEDIEKAKNYLSRFAGDYTFNDGSGSAVRINSDGSLSVKLPGFTKGSGFVDVSYTPTFTTSATESVGDYVSSVQFPIPGWYANASLNSPAYLTLNWQGNADPIVNHYFTNSSTAFFRTAEDYKIISAGRFYSDADREKAAA